jgi:hypothetical protein
LALLPLHLLVAASLVPLSGAAQSVVSNTATKVDAATGAILDIHDGNTLRVGDVVRRRATWGISRSSNVTSRGPGGETTMDSSPVSARKCSRSASPNPGPCPESIRWTILRPSS